MKKNIIIVVVIIIIAISAYLSLRHTKESTSTDIPISYQGKYCYEYHQAATDSAPYKVDESMTINIIGTNVTGTEQGTQFGPDMSNGYQGTLNGSLDTDMITVIYNYTVEGSNNQEQEEYRITPSSLIKQRYPLVEKNKILVPDKTGELKEIVYNKVECK